MKTRLAMASDLATFVALGGILALAQPQGKGNRNKTASDKVREVFPPSEVVFTEQERLMVKNWFGNHRGGLPPGLAKRDRLPPGLPTGYRRVVIGGNAIVMNEKTALIYDIIRNVIP